MSETIKQGERVEVEFTQGATLEGNLFFFASDGVTPYPGLENHTAIMEFREFPDDADALVTITSEDGDIILSESGLIVWEVSGSVTAALEAQKFKGDLFVVAPDGDSVHVMGYDVTMAASYTRVPE